MEHFQDFARDLATGACVPGATVAVYVAGTLTPAAIYSDNAGTPTPKSNPLTAHAVSGYFDFYAANGRYDVTVSKTGYSTYSLSDVLLDDPAEG